MDVVRFCDPATTRRPMSFWFSFGLLRLEAIVFVSVTRKSYVTPGGGAVGPEGTERLK